METLSKNYRLEVAPLSILPLGRSPLFSYLSDEPVTPGTLVAIPFGRQKLQGIVYACQPLPGRAPHWMKRIASVAKPDFLTADQLDLARWIGEEYFTPLGKVLRHFIPKQVKERKKASTGTAMKRKTISPTKDEREILKRLETITSGSAGFLDTASIEDETRLFALLAKKTAAKKKQTLILVPELTLIPPLLETISAAFQTDEIALLHSKLADGPYWNAWERIHDGRATVIIGTRQSLFAPFSKLGTIIVTEEQDESYKQWDMSPRYDGKRVARTLASLTAAKLLLVSRTPSAESIQGMKDSSLVGIVPDKQAALGDISIINLRLERYRKNYSPLSEELVAGLRSVFAEKRQAILYINRQGLSAFSVCERCREILRCPDCGRALTGDKDGSFHCLSCGHRTALFPNCPRCGHLSFRHIGFGTERIEREVLRLFPGARIFRADGSTMRKPGAAERLHEKITSGSIDILIGTQMILKGPALPKLSLIAMIDADSLLAFPDFRADERLFQDIFRGRLRVGPRGKVVIQTFHPEGTFFQRVTTEDRDTFTGRILAEREALGYPPFSRLISIFLQGKTEEETKEKSSRFFEELERLIGKKKEFRVSPPLPPVALRRAGTFRGQIFLRVPEDEPLPPTLRSLLLKHDKELIIDVDPLSLT